MRIEFWESKGKMIFSTTTNPSKWPTLTLQTIGQTDIHSDKVALLLKLKIKDTYYATSLVLVIIIFINMQSVL